MRTLRNAFSTSLIAVVPLSAACSGSTPADDLDVDRSSQRLTADQVPYQYPIRETAPGLLELWLDTEHGRGNETTAVALQVTSAPDADGTAATGLVAFPRRTLTDQEVAERAAEKGETFTPTRPEKISATTAEAIAKLEDGQLLMVTVVAQYEDDVPMFAQLEDLVVAGEVRTEADVERERERLRFARKVAFQQVRAPVVARLQEVGAEEIIELDNLPMISAKMTSQQLAAVVADERIRRIDANTPMMPDHGSIIVRGAHQTQQFLDAGFNGGAANLAQVSSYDMTFAQVEGTPPDDEHPGYRESTSTTNYRIRDRYACNSSLCALTYNFTLEEDHPSAVAGIIFGDLTQGQDSAITNVTQRADRSGMATESRGHLVLAASGSPRVLAYDQIIDLTGAQVHVVNQSAGNDPGNCAGDTDLDIAANLMFEAGILLVKSAGNDYHNSTATCTTNLPAAAIGAFTVGGIGNSKVEASVGALKGAATYNKSSMGGYGGRSIVSLAASACRELMFDAASGYTYEDCGTSFSTPVVTGTALDFIDWFKVSRNSAIDNPGILFANLLLMGNRQTYYGGPKMVTGFDPVLGAGALRARRFDTTGLDDPKHYATASVCVGRHQAVPVDIPNPVTGGQIIDAQVDALEAVIYWYDSRHSSGTLDDIDLRLINDSTSTTITSNTGVDNKERIYYNAPGGKNLSLELYGYNVTADSAGCGTDSMRVYYAWYYEDTARDAPENLVDIDAP